MTRKPVVYHIISEGRRQVSAASTLVVRAGRVAVELDPQMLKAKGVFVEIDPAKLRKLDEDGWVFGYPELVDRRRTRSRRRRERYSGAPSCGRRKVDRETRRY
ncbi:MAG: hypothetical protein E6H77_08905 [Betaproteobacteria bacterium]|nr:MAG: hypothetical protein E6H77_08905 [Betaproteobacteria bacterium]